MQIILRSLVALIFIAGAFSAYSYGHTTGLFIFIILGFCLEAAFWLKLFPPKRRRDGQR